MMKTISTKSLSERVAARFNVKTSASARNRASFLALSDEIKQALNDGWKSKNIWETLYGEGKIDFSYPTFHAYVSKLIVLPTSEKIVRQEKSLIGEKKPVVKNQGMPGFSYNPIPNMEDLI